MKLIVFGATGLVGKQLVKQALHNGHQVKAYGRNVFTEDFPKDDNLELVQGALFDERQAYKAIKGCDAVLAALGGAAGDTEVTRSLGMKNIVAQMQKAGVARIVALGNIGMLNEDEETLVMEAPGYPAELYHEGREHFKAYETLKSSNLEWTFVCPPDIVDGAPSGDFHTSADYPPNPVKNEISSGDVALFMLNELERKQFTGHRVGISN